MRIELAPFLLLSAFLIVIPGPDTAVVTKNALLGGRRPGVSTAVGVAIGLMVWTVAAAFGLAALLRASSVAFDAVKIVGALYLIWIGIQLFRTRTTLTLPANRPPVVGAGRKALRQGLLSDLGNPKIAVFFTSFLPQFVDGNGSAFWSLLVLGALFAAMTLAWLTLYGVAVARASDVIQRPAVRKTLDRVTGVVLIGFGIRLAFEHR